MLYPLVTVQMCPPVPLQLTKVEQRSYRLEEISKLPWLLQLIGAKKVLSTENKHVQLKQLKVGDTLWCISQSMWMQGNKYGLRYDYAKHFTKGTSPDLDVFPTSIITCIQIIN